MAPRSDPRRKRWDRFNRQPHCRRSFSLSIHERHSYRRDSWPSSWRDVHGGRRVRLRQFAAGHGKADIERETKELREEPAAELEELVSIYENRRLERNLAVEVARQLMEHDPLGTHLRDELGMFEQAAARPVQAAVSSAAAFSVGAAMPLLAAVLAPPNLTSWAVSGSALVSLAILGSVGAAAGGAGMAKAAARVTFWGALAMAVTAAIGAIVGTTVG